MAADLNLLAEVPLFQLLDDEERKTLSGLLDVRTFNKGEIIFAYGDPGEALFIVRRGSVQVYVEDRTGQHRSDSVDHWVPEGEAVGVERLLAEVPVGTDRDAEALGH